jgi:hypothetical protein
MKTADGRERGEALITDFERSQSSTRSEQPRYDFNQLRVALGVAEPQNAIVLEAARDSRQAR